MVLAMVSIWVWLSISGTKCLVTSKVMKCEWSSNFGEDLEKLDSRFYVTVVK